MESMRHGNGQETPEHGRAQGGAGEEGRRVKRKGQENEGRVSSGLPLLFTFMFKN